MAGIWERLMYTLDAWKNYGYLNESDYLQSRYDERWSLYNGTAFEQALKRGGFRSGNQAHQGLYRGTRLLTKHTEATVDFYAAHVYSGDISTDGKPLPDGTKGALPIDPQVGEGEPEANLRKAIAELTVIWNWKAQMSQRPMYAAALGDSMTRLVDDTERGAVYPEIIWPGWVKEIELDFVGNVKAYVIEYKTAEKNPQTGKLERFDYREEADKESFRYFRNDKPWDRFGPGTAVTLNPYGFVPAIWDRHKVVPGVRGAAAIDGTRQALYEINSFLSHAIDHQKKLFYTPVLVSGRVSKPGQKTIDLSQPPEAYAARDDASWFAETFPIWPVGDGAAIHQVNFDIGATERLITMLQEGIYNENPEARFYPELRAMSQLTAPGAERALGDAVSRVKQARANQDPNTVKLIQMAIAMAGYRANGGFWAGPLNVRQKAFLPFTLDSFKAGLLDFGIEDRPVLIPSESDRLGVLLQKQMLGVPDETLWDEMGYGDRIDEFHNAKDEATDRARMAFNRGDVSPGFGNQ